MSDTKMPSSPCAEASPDGNGRSENHLLVSLDERRERPFLTTDLIMLEELGIPGPCHAFDGCGTIRFPRVNDRFTSLSFAPFSVPECASAFIFPASQKHARLQKELGSLSGCQR